MNIIKASRRSLGVVLFGLYAISSVDSSPLQAAEALKTGKQVYGASCVGCHAAGVLGAPKYGSKSDWQKREKQGIKLLEKHAINGFNNMPAKGGNMTLKNGEIKRAIAYMLSESGFKQYAKLAGTTVVSTGKKIEKVKKKVTRPKSYTSINRFNRLMKPSSAWNPSPMKDGIHDPQNDGTELLQPPKDAFAGLPSAKSGNRLDWVKALHEGEITPRYDRLDPDALPVVMDLNIVREVKGSMPNVVYPHKQHTEWLDCSNCHPAIFIPQKGANQISMASILMGQQCGVCHGKVAFPVSECRKCHSQKKRLKVVKK